MIFGIPYMGSKTKTAPDIIRQLPAGERFVDLFGGGFAMSQAAAISGKYKKVLYNDINPLLPPLIQKAIRGGGITIIVLSQYLSNLKNLKNSG